MADLTGVWTADDGGTYYIQQRDDYTVSWVGLYDGGDERLFHKGLVFTNVFRGTLSADLSEVTGVWADVPRGDSMNFGDLTLFVNLDDNQAPLSMLKTSEHGGFAGSRWFFLSRTPDRTFPPMDGLLNRINKNVSDVTLETLADNLELAKEPVVLYGQLIYGVASTDLPFSNVFPKWLHTTWKYFVEFNDKISHFNNTGTDQDLDMTCHIVIDPFHLPDDLFQFMTPEHQAEVLQKIAMVHPEVVMFARHIGDDDDPPPLLPGWAEMDGYSVLINGVPMNGAYDVDNKTGVTSIGVNCIKCKPGDEVRITGALVFDKGHPDRQLELHPVYAIDFINARSVDDHSGVWGDTSSYTYYIHQVYNRLWMYVGSPFRGVYFAAVFAGDIQADGKTVVGDWTTVPLTGSDVHGPMALQLDPGNFTITVSAAGPLSGRVLQKLYDKRGHPCPSIGKVEVAVQGAEICQVKEIAGSTVVYEAVNPALAGLTDPQYVWSAQGATIIGSNSQTSVEVQLQGAGTIATVAVDISAQTGCKYHGERRFRTVTPAEANSLQLWCEIRLNTVATVNGYVAQARIGPPAVGNPPSPPDDVVLEKLEQNLVRMSELVRQMRHPPGK